MQIWQLSHFTASCHLNRRCYGCHSAECVQGATDAAASTLGSWCCHHETLHMHCTPAATCSTMADVATMTRAWMPTLWCCSGACARVRDTHCRCWQCCSAQALPACWGCFAGGPGKRVPGGLQHDCAEGQGRVQHPAQERGGRRGLRQSAALLLQQGAMSAPDDCSPNVPLLH